MIIHPDRIAVETTEKMHEGQKKAIERATMTQVRSPHL